MNERDKYAQNLRVTLEEWNAEIDKLAAKGEMVSADIRKEYAEQIESLKAKRDKARQKLDDLQKAGDEAWEDLKSGIDLATSAMNETLNSIKSRFIKK